MAKTGASYTGSGVFRLIIVAIIGLPLALVGGIDLYRNAHPEPASERLVRAIDAYKGNETAIAHRLFKSLAAQGNAAAEYWLADMHQHGLATTKSISEAITLLEQSAKKGFVPASLRLGELYLSGFEVAPDLPKARTYLEQAATSGNSTAQRLLGQVYSLGLGTRTDDVMALTYFIAAAEQGDIISRAERDALERRLQPPQTAEARARAAALGLLIKK